MQEPNDAQDAITQWLTLLRECQRGNGIPTAYAYAGIGDFLLQHGAWHQPVPFPAKLFQGAPKSCFGNALLLSRLYGYRYIEGYASADISKMPFPAHHAWNLDSQGNLIDNTWRNSGLAYLGVEFSAGRAEEAIWFDDGCVLDNVRSKFAIFRDPWTGENPALQWRKSKQVKRVMREIGMR